jgi:hypothetical protein
MTIKALESKLVTKGLFPASFLINNRLRKTHTQGTKTIEAKHGWQIGIPKKHSVKREDQSVQINSSQQYHKHITLRRPNLVNISNNTRYKHNTNPTLAVSARYMAKQRKSLPLSRTEFLQ